MKMDKFVLEKPFDGTFAVTQTFAEHVAYKAEKHLQYYNGGIDSALPDGTPVKAAAAGLVTDAGPDNTGYGNHVEIRHANGYVSLYAHLSRIDVKVGQQVSVGVRIGLSGWSGNVRPASPAGAHLHFEVRLNGMPVDPAPLLAQGETVMRVNISAPAGAAHVSTEMVRVRMAPSLNGEVLVWLHQGDVVEVCGEPVEADGVMWVQVKAYMALVDQYGTKCIE
jgi:hypothetical protein